MPQSKIIPAFYQQIPEACNFIAAAAKKAGFDEGDIFKLQLACDEACTNIIEHAYENNETAANKIHLNYKIEGDKFCITILDHGRPFDPKKIKAPPIPPNPKNAKSLKIGGLGLHIIRKVMDEVYYHFDKRGNTITMIKRFPKQQESG